MLRIIGWVVLALAAGALLLLLTPAVIRVRYAEKLEIWLGIGPVKLKIFPAKQKKKTEKAKKSKENSRNKKAEQKSETKKKRKKERLTLERPALGELPAYVRLGGQALRSMRRRLVIRELRLAITLGGDDAARTALNYGRVAALFSIVGPMLEEAFRVRRRDVSVDADFSGGPNRAEGEITIAACPLRLVIAGLRLLFAFLALQREGAREKSNETEMKGGNEHEQYSGCHEAHTAIIIEVGVKISHEFDLLL